jgi:hypothetical protein
MFHPLRFRLALNETNLPLESGSGQAAVALQLSIPRAPTHWPLSRRASPDDQVRDQREVVAGRDQVRGVDAVRVVGRP